MPIRNIFFDIGFTLLFQDTSVTLAPLTRAGLHPTREQLHGAEKFAKMRLDEAHGSPGQGSGVDFDFWANYHRHLMRSLGLQDDELMLGELILLSRKSANWSVFAEGIPDLLESLSSKYTLGVISNADGRLVRSLEILGLRKYFASVTDSGVLGYEKPSAAIFQSALMSTRAFARESLYVGDIYSLDYHGARQAGMHALLMDVAGVYAESPFTRIGGFAEFGSALLQLAAQGPAS